jgi:general secretion pathway protein B
MSLILEALRKSEAERRRGAAPDLHTELPTSPVLARSTVPGWVLWILAAAAAIALLLWGARAWWPSTPASMVATRAATPVSTPTAVKPALPPVSRLSPPPAMVAPPVATAVEPTGKPARPSTPPAELVPPPAVQRAPVATPVAEAPQPDDALSLSDLTPDERKALPPLKLSMHLWNDDASRRFVILDGNRLREGDRDGDAVITAITTDGVLLDWNGRRIKVSIR